MFSEEAPLSYDMVKSGMGSTSEGSVAPQQTFELLLRAAGAGRLCPGLSDVGAGMVMGLWRVSCFAVGCRAVR